MSHLFGYNALSSDESSVQDLPASNNHAKNTSNDHSVCLTEVQPENPSRRALLKAGLIGAGGILFGFQLPYVTKARASTPAQGTENSFPVQAWIELNPKNEAVLIIPVSEMGQGSLTALTMIFAEELGADYAQVKVHTALNNRIYNNPVFNAQVTGGSSAVRGWWQPLGQVGATIREMLATAAAKRWQVDARKCIVKNHHVIHPDGKKTLSFSALIPDLKNIAPPSSPALKTPDQYQYLGKSLPRIDTPAKVNGTAVFGMDVVVDGMLIATVAQAPTFGGEIKEYDEKAAMSIPGVKQVVKIPHGVAVVADTYWQAQKGLKALDPLFSNGKSAGLTNEIIYQRLHNGLLKSGEQLTTAHSIPRSAKSYKATYQVPYLAHTTMEPMNATAHVTDDKCEVWAPTQNQAMATQIAAEMSLLQPDKVIIHTTYLGGGFGRRGNVDYIGQAVYLSQEMGVPVKVIWSREEDIQHDFYRPAAVCDFEVKTDEKGFPIEWRTKVVSDSVYASFINGGDDMIDRTMHEGLADQDYKIDNMDLEVVRESLKIPLGYWRSVGFSGNSFFLEGMVNELANAAKMDAVSYRKQMLDNNSRAYNVLTRLEKLAQWEKPLAKDHGRGVALVKSFKSYAAQVVEAHIENNQIIVDKVYCVIDCGRVVHPGIVKRQMSSAIIYGLSAALHGEMHFKNGAIAETNFDNYPMLTLKETPEIVVELIESENPPGGYGEPGLPPVAPALAGALLQLTGKAHRTLPFRLSA